MKFVVLLPRSITIIIVKMTEDDDNDFVDTQDEDTTRDLEQSNDGVEYDHDAMRNDTPGRLTLRI